MRLTDSTELRLLANGRFIAVVSEVSAAPAKLVKVTDRDVFTCGWQYANGYTEDGDAVISECGALAVGFDNGFACLNGHYHRNDAEYYERDEFESALRSGNIAPNARLV